VLIEISEVFVAMFILFIYLCVTHFCLRHGECYLFAFTHYEQFYLK